MTDGMLCWQFEDQRVQKMNPFPFMPGNPSNIPLPWSSSAPLCVDHESGVAVDVKPAPFYQNPRSHPWRPVTNFEPTVKPSEMITNDLVNTSYSAAGMQTEPLKYPNLVTGFDKNPQHAARSALYTRYTPLEWSSSNISTWANADSNRNNAERMRSEAVRLMRETDEKTSIGQRDAGRRLGERVTDVTFWRNELNTELEKLVAESALLADCKRNVQKALQDTEAPLHIAKECLYHREARRDIELVHDHVEKSLLFEVDNLKQCQEKLSNMLARIVKQLADCRAAQFDLEDDVCHKESALGIDNVCHQLNNFSRGINYYSGVEKYDPTISTTQTWAGASNQRINRSQTERARSSQMRSDAEALINQCATAIWDCWSNSNNSLNKRASETMEAKSKMQLQLHKTQQEIFDVEKHIDLLRKAINDKSNPLKVAQTRLEARCHRPGMEICRDNAHTRLVEEVCDIQESVAALHRKLQEAEQNHQRLLKTRANLEINLKNKVDALFIDREKCMGIRRSFPVNNTIKY